MHLLWDKHQIHIWCLFSWNNGQHKHALHVTTALLLRNTWKFQILFLFFLPALVWMTAVLLPTGMSACFPLKCLFLGKYYIWSCFASGFPTWSLYNRSMPCWEIRGVLAASAVCCCEMPPCSSLIMIFECCLSPGGFCKLRKFKTRCRLFEQSRRTCLLQQPWLVNYSSVCNWNAQILKGRVTKSEVKDQRASSKTGRLAGPGGAFSIHLHLFRGSAFLWLKTEFSISEAMCKHVSGKGRGHV